MRTELRDADDPVARTKPPGEVNAGELEAVLPPGTELVDVGGRGPLQSLARRLGIGSDFAVEIGDRSVPLRPATDPDLQDTASDTQRADSFLGDTRGQVGTGRRTDTDIEDSADLFGRRRYTFDRSDRALDPGTDRPLPVTGTGGGSSLSREDTGESTSERRAVPSRSQSSVSSVVGRYLSSSPPASGASPSGSSVGGGSSSEIGRSSAGSGSSSSSFPGSSTGGSSSSSSSGGSGGGGSSGFVPPGPPRPPSGRRNDRDDRDDDRDRLPLFGGRRDPNFTDFLNPLSGGVLETTREDISKQLDEPVFVGYDSPPWEP